MTEAVTGAVRRSRWMRWALLALVVASLIAFAPLVSVMASSAIAQSHGCALDEGGVHPCVVLGADRGELLYDMFVMGWLFLLTMPLAIAAGIGWVGLAIVALIRALRRGAA